MQWKIVPEELVDKVAGNLARKVEEAGFKHIQLRPNFVKELKWFEAKHQAPRGEIVSKWQWKGKRQVDYEVVVPANSTATLHLPASVEGDKEVYLEAGHHRLRFSIKR